MFNYARPLLSMKTMANSLKYFKIYMLILSTYCSLHPPILSLVLLHMTQAPCILPFMLLFSPRAQALHLKYQSLLLRSSFSFSPC